MIVFFSTLAYTSQLYSEFVAMCPAVSYAPYATSSRGESGDIITFAQFEEGCLLSETRSSLSETRDNT